MKYYGLILTTLLTLAACTSTEQNREDMPSHLHTQAGEVPTDQLVAARQGNRLPIVGHHDVTPEGDTIYHTIRDFAFYNQDSVRVTNATYEDKVRVVDFFFTFCSTICGPIKRKQLELYEEFAGEERLMFLSHTLAPENDDVATLRTYASNLDLETDRWHLVTGDVEDIYSIHFDYFISATRDPSARDGINHGSTIALVDSQGRVRSVANALDDAQMVRFEQDIRLLLAEEKRTATD